ncbi:DUF2235 domain-containing protein [Mycena sanguinolenta]|uniref:DUF2235 domain-containing protein n=1 Tax=Mycena sanguinolenta TaxID=230812 RepID=A0A8H7D1V7_9AGAR|nr:DUF2235 domain-containing protein [Mycena sanguinolenta]
MYDFVSQDFATAVENRLFELACTGIYSFRNRTRHYKLGRDRKRPLVLHIIVYTHTNLSTNTRWFGSQMEPSPTINTRLHKSFETDHTLFDQNGISGLPLASSPQSSSFTHTQQPFNGSASSTTGVIPPEHPFRTLVLCFDGTGDQFDNDNSNIVQLFSMLLKGDRSRQMVYYQAGMGTYTTPQIATPFWSAISKLLDKVLLTANKRILGLGWSLNAHVMGKSFVNICGYEFLMQNYTAKDRICIFGFSRGAYTARSLAGMLHKVGLLPADNHQQVPFAVLGSTRQKVTSWLSEPFGSNLACGASILRNVIQPLLGAQTRYYHASASANKPSQYKMYTNDTEVGWAQSNAFKKAFSIDVDIEFVGVWVWFAGCHCDVGGGSVANDVVQNLARIPLRWMIRECFKTNSGIMFTCEGLRSIGLDPDKLYPEVAPRPPALPLGNLRIQSIPSKQLSKKQTEAAITNFANGETTPPTHRTEEELDLLDSVCPIYDQLSLSWPWWILEFLPIKQHYHQGDNSWVTEWGWNMGRGRKIPRQKTNGIRVHRSVKTRLEAQTESGGKYKPKATFDLERATWVD